MANYILVDVAIVDVPFAGLVVVLFQVSIRRGVCTLCEHLLLGCRTISGVYAIEVPYFELVVHQTDSASTR